MDQRKTGLREATDKQRKAYYRDFEWAFGLNRIWLNFMGVWPKEFDTKSTTVETDQKYLRIPVLLLAIVIGYWAPQIYAIPKVYRDFKLLLDNLMMNYSTLTVIAKLFFLWKNREVYGPLMGHALLDWKNAQSSRWEYKIMRKQARRAQFFTMCGYIVMLFTFTAFMIFPIFGLSIRIINNITDIADGNRFLPIQSYYPFDFGHSPYFEIVFVSQMIVCSFCAACFSMPDYFFGALVFHASAQCEILAVKVQALFSPQTEAGVSNTFLEIAFFRAKIRPIMERHVHLISKDLFQIANSSTVAKNKFMPFLINLVYYYILYSLVEDIEKSFNLIILAQTMYAIIVICGLGFNVILSLTTESHEAHILPAMSLGATTFMFMVHLFVYCFASEILAIHSEGICEAAYNSNWYMLPTKCARNIIPIMVRASYPLQISSGKFFYLSLNAFLSIVKTSFGYMSVLLAVNT